MVYVYSKKYANKAFSLVELSIVILIIGVLVAAVGQGLDLLSDAKVSAAKQITQSSRVASLKGLELWLETTMDSSFAATEAVDGAGVSVWYDLNTQVGNKNNASQSNSTYKPIYTQSAINGLPALKFNGTNSYFLVDNANFYGGSSGVTTFFVAASGNTDNVQDVLRVSQSFSLGLTSTGAGSSYVRCGRWYSSDSANSWVGSWTPASSPNVKKGQPVICSSRYNGSQVQGWTNGITADTAGSLTGNITGTASPWRVVIGSDNISPSGIELFGGYIGEILFFSRALTQKEMDTVESYLGKKWGIRTN